MFIRLANLINENGVWFVSSHGSYLMRLDLETEETLCKSVLPERNASASTSALQRIGEYIITAPLNGNCFYAFHIYTGELTCIYEEKEYSCLKKYFSSFKVNEKAYFIGAKTRKIISVCIEDGKPVCREIEINVDYLLDKDTDMALQTAVTGSKAYISINGTSNIFVLDTLINTCELVEVSKRKIFNMAVSDGYDVWLISEQLNAVYKLDTKTNRAALFSLLPEEEILEKRRRFSGAVCCNGSMWIYPFYSGMLIKMNLESGETVCIKQYKREDVKYLNAGSLDDTHVWGYNSIDNTVDIINCVDGILQSIKPKKPSNYLSYINFVDEDGNSSVIEEYELGLDQFLNYLNAEKRTEDHSSEHEINIGKNIWNSIREEME